MPGQKVTVLIQRDGINRLSFIDWGLIPRDTHHRSIGAGLFQVRAESALELDRMVERIRARRCGIVVDGFFIWQHDRGETQPWYCTMSGGNPFVLAGVWEVWRREYKDAVHSCAIISTSANELIDPVHSRMPTILSPNQLDSWLNQEIEDEAELLNLCRPYSGEHMELHKVSIAVENPLDDTLDVIQPVL